MLQRDFKISGNRAKSHLSVTLTKDQLNFAVFDTDGVLIKHQSYENLVFSSSDTFDLLKSNPDFNENYDKISVIAITGNTHQLSFLDEDISNIIPGFEFKDVHIEKLPGSTVYNYYGISQAQINILDLLFGANKYKIHTFVFGLSSFYIGIQQPLLHIHLEEKMASIFIQKEGILNFYNSYSYKSANDLLYFILAACKLHAINPTHDSKIISGMIEKESEIFQSFLRYMGNIKFIENPNFKLIQGTEFKPHYYFTHFMSKSCV